MSPLIVVVLLGTLLAVNGEKHSLFYIYTTISKPIQGIHEFTAMGLLDGRIIDYYDSSTQVKEPRTPWIKRLKPADYWSKGSESLKGKHKWLKININSLLKQTRDNNTDPHILQWLHGCTGELHPGKKMMLEQVMDRYGWDGEDFLSFDDVSNVWVAPNPIAKETKLMWDEDGVLKEYSKHCLEKECLGFLDEFVNSAQEDFKTASPPEVYTLRRNARVETHNILVCMATGFISEDTAVHIKQDGRMLTERDGFTSGEVLPNEDGTFQRTVRVEILKSDKSTYTCEVFDVATDQFQRRVWEDEPAGNSMGLIGGVLGGLVVLVLVGFGVVFLVKRQRDSASPESIPSQDSCVYWTSAMDLQSTTIDFKKSSQDSIPSQDSGVSSTTAAAEQEGLMEGEQH